MRVNFRISIVRIPMLAQATESVPHLASLDLQLEKPTNMLVVIAAISVVFDEARLLKIRKILINEAAIFTYLVVHPLELILRYLRRTQTCQATCLGQLAISEGFTQQGLHSLRLRLNLVPQIINV